MILNFSFLVLRPALFRFLTPHSHSSLPPMLTSAFGPPCLNQSLTVTSSPLRRFPPSHFRCALCFVDQVKRSLKLSRQVAHTSLSLRAPSGFPTPPGPSTRAATDPDDLVEETRRHAPSGIGATGAKRAGVRGRLCAPCAQDLDTQCVLPAPEGEELDGPASSPPPDAGR
jgi:hypothetical protein